MARECPNKVAAADTTPTPLELVADPDHYEETLNFTVRRHLSLRPTGYRNDDKPDSHPDQRPCPPWCWVGLDPAQGHEVDPFQPFHAMHSMEPFLSVALSRYRGATNVGWVETASVEARMTQLGQGRTRIDLGVRAADQEGKMLFSERLRLTVDEALELSRVLTYLAAVDAGREGIPVRSQP